MMSVKDGCLLRFYRGIMNHCRHSVGGTNDRRVGSPRRSISSLGSYNKAVKNLSLLVNQTSNQEKTYSPASQPENLTFPIGKVNQHHKIPSDESCNRTKKFSIIQPRSIDKLRINRSEFDSIDTGNNLETSYESLQSGMIVLKNYISLNDQVEIVKLCQEFGVRPGGFYEPYVSNGVQHRLLMCFGRNWQPATNFDERVRRNDGSEAPPIPDKLLLFAQSALQDARAFLNSEEEIPSMYPDASLVNFYPTAGRLGLHQDCHESSYSLRRGLPIISFSIGDAAEFLYGDTRVVKDANKVLLKSGDVLIFGGKSRLVFHGVKKIIPDSAPLALLKQTMLRPGRLNLNFRQY